MNATIRKPYLVFLGDVENEAYAKTAFGIVDWSPGDVVGQFRHPECRIDLNVPDLTMAVAQEAGAKSLLIGVSPIGGLLPDHWVEDIVAAIEAGLDIVSGLHTRLNMIEKIREAATRKKRRLHDVRHADGQFSVGTGRKRSGKRLLTVGTDCALGKKYTALAITRELRANGIDATFRATGQTGIVIAGDGVPIDAVVADFIAGAAETLSPDAPPEHWDVIEGQGSLFHPAYAGVSLGLLHGSQPDALVLCHDPTRKTLNMYPDFPMPSLTETVESNLHAARLTNPKAEFVGCSVNTKKLSSREAAQVVAGLEKQLGVPCTDPIRFGVECIVKAM